MRRFLMLLLLSGGLQQISAQKMRDVFAHMPDSVLGLMTEYNRLDCIDFIENNVEAKVRNRMDGFSILQKLTADYLHLNLTAQTEVEMKLLFEPDSAGYIALVKTYAAPVKSSTLAFYKMDWTPLPVSDFVQWPAYDAFWKEGADTLSSDPDSLQGKDIREKLDVRFVSARLSEADNSLTFTLTPALVEEKDSVEISKCIRPVRYEWKGKRFEEKK